MKVKHFKKQEKYIFRFYIIQSSVLIPNYCTACHHCHGIVTLPYLHSIKHTYYTTQLHIICTV